MRRLSVLVVAFALFAGTFAFAGEHKLPTAFVFKNESKRVMDYVVRPMGPYFSVNRYVLIKNVRPGETFYMGLGSLLQEWELVDKLDGGDPVRILITAGPVDNHNIRIQWNDLILVKRSISEEERVKKVKLRF